MADVRETFDRQVRAFGRDGQKRMQDAQVTVIGAGGQGSIIIEGLTRLGVGAITVVDPDLAEISNLNRVVGMTHSDAVLGVSKAQIAARTALEINPAVRVRWRRSSIFDKEVLAAVKGSDLLIVATDNHSSRLLCQQLAAQFLIPLVHAGVNVEADRGQIGDVA